MKLPPKGALDYVASQCRDQAQRQDLSDSERDAFKGVGKYLQHLMARPAIRWSPAGAGGRMSELPRWRDPTDPANYPPKVKTRHHLAAAVRFSPREIKQAMSEVEGFNAKLALLITRGVGTMACAYLFAILALISLPDALKAGRPAIISWIAQTFLQLVLLSIIMVGQTVQAKASDARAVKEFADTEVIVDRLDETTAGGIKAVLDAVDVIGRSVIELHEKLEAKP